MDIAAVHHFEQFGGRHEVGALGDESDAVLAPGGPAEVRMEVDGRVAGAVDSGFWHGKGTARLEVLQGELLGSEGSGKKEVTAGA